MLEVVLNIKFEPLESILIRSESHIKGDLL